MADLKVMYSVCEKLSDELENANRRVEKSGKLSTADIEYLDKLTHAIKSIKTVIAMEEAYGDEYSENYRGNSYRGNSYYDGGSYARARERASNVRRNAMDRYSRDSKNMAHEMRDLMNMTTDERTKRELQRMIDEME